VESLKQDRHARAAAVLSFAELRVERAESAYANARLYAAASEPGFGDDQGSGRGGWRDRFAHRQWC